MAARGARAGTGPCPARRGVHGCECGRARKSPRRGIDGEAARVGWVEGHNIRFDVRWLGSETGRASEYAAELVRLSPDLLVVNGPTVLDLQRATTTIPIVFVQVPAPVELGVVPSLARPGGMTTGFTHFEFDIAGKWLELLKEISPSSRQVAFLVLPEHPATPGFLRT